MTTLIAAVMGLCDFQRELAGRMVCWDNPIENPEIYDDMMEDAEKTIVMPSMKQRAEARGLMRMRPEQRKLFTDGLPKVSKPRNQHYRPSRPIITDTRTTRQRKADALKYYEEREAEGYKYPTITY